MTHLIAFICACVLIPASQTLATQRNPTKKTLAIPVMHSATTDFKVDWCRQRMSRYDFKSRLQSCWNKFAWESPVDPFALDTDPRYSYVTLDIKPAGYYSKVNIQTVTRTRRKKTNGGDFFRVYIQGPSNMAATVIDRHDGSYEALFLVMVPGIYMITVILDYTMCKGIKDPPMDWFYQGKLGRYRHHYAILVNFNTI